MATCPEPKIINISGLEWNKHDHLVLESNTGFCKRKLPNKPCVIKFVKLNYQSYHILCGDKRKEK